MSLKEEFPSLVILSYCPHNESAGNNSNYLKYLCPKCGKPTKKRLYHLRNGCDPTCSDCIGHGKKYILQQFSFLGEVEYVKSTPTSHTSLKYRCPKCGGVTVRAVSTLRRLSDYKCPSCCSLYEGLLYDSVTNSINLKAWRRAVCKYYSYDFSYVSSYDAHHVISRGNLMSMGIEYYKSYSTSVKNCMFLPRDVHHRVHSGSYSPCDGFLYDLQEANFNRDISFIGKFAPDYWIKHHSN